MLAARRESAAYRHDVPSAPRPAAILGAVALTAACQAGAPTGGPGPSPSSTAAPGCRGTVTLTFDDGPAPGATRDLLGVLGRLDAPAAFFMVGRQIDAHPALARAVARAGYAVGNHTYDHEDLTALGPAAGARTLRRTDAALERAGVPATSLVRLPFGRSDPAVAALLRREGRVKVGWNTPAHDGGPGAVGDTSAELATRVLDGLRPDRANVVLQHDGGPVAAETIAAVPAIVSGARADGYCVVGLGADGRPESP